jgi:hypothetical protein
MCSSTLKGDRLCREARRNVTFSNPNASVKENRNLYSFWEVHLSSFDVAI